MRISRNDYRTLAERSINHPVIALYACCACCGTEIGVHQSTALSLNKVLNAGVNFCEYKCKACMNNLASRDRVCSRIDRLNGHVDEDLPDDLEQNVPVHFEIAV